jgi:hypothetical protein
VTALDLLLDEARLIPPIVSGKAWLSQREWELRFVRALRVSEDGVGVPP